ncbi:MAG: hypothetical protein MK116_01345 [Phycisphaerales bacterium]|nr:hypothetical protein [Phycisphaerales bacterium]
MKRHGVDIMTLFIVTVVTVLIWMLAEARTREAQTIKATIEFSVPGQGNFVISPSQIPVDIGVEGPAEAVREMQQALQEAIALPVTAQRGQQTVDDLAQAISDIERIRRTGATIVSVLPPFAEVQVEELITRTATVQAVLPTVSTVENVEANQEVSVTLPARDADRLPQPLTVEAVVPQGDVERLQPGYHTVEGIVRLQSDLGTFDSVTFTPAQVRVSFRLVSRVKTIDLEQVRIQINSAPQDFGKYRVTLPEQFLRNVSIEADADVVARLEKGEGQVVAVVYLSTNDKERRLEKKPVAYFTALFPDGIGYPVTATVDGKANPEIDLKITPLGDPAE